MSEVNRQEANVVFTWQPFLFVSSKVDPSLTLWHDRQRQNVMLSRTFVRD